MSSLSQKDKFQEVLKWSSEKLASSPSSTEKAEKAPYNMTWVIGIFVLLIVLIVLYIWYCNRNKAASAGGAASGGVPAAPPPVQSGVSSVPLPPQA